jgi:hypothetical protein
MVRRCKLKSIRRQTRKEAKHEGTHLISSGELVVFICLGKPCSHRFHIIEDASFPFDMLYGTEFVEEETE